eukprot:m.1585116 g.1585116  ORF g.1585116 m.1585116 type:complete len:71 (-) comp25322_c0_seq16:75-287(-)
MHTGMFEPWIVNAGQVHVSQFHHYIRDSTEAILMSRGYIKSVPLACRIKVYTAHAIGLGCKQPFLLWKKK